MNGRPAVEKTEQKSSKTYHWFVRLLSAISFLIASGLFSVNARADTVIAESFARPGDPLVWYITGAEGDLTDTADSLSAYVGDTPCLVSAGSVTDLKPDNVYFRTVVLVDNSLSISSENREKIKETIVQLIQNHVDGENFELYTFDTELHQIGSGTDYSSLIKAVNDVTFNDQDAYLIECTASILEDLSARDDYCYDRIILFSDGVDDNTHGRTYDELKEMLEDDTYRCPLHTVVSEWEKDDTGLKKLESLSRETDSVTFTLDDTPDVSEISHSLQNDYNAKYLRINVPLEEKNGTEKSVSAFIQTSQGEYNLQHAVTIPNLSSEEREQLREEEELREAARRESEEAARRESEEIARRESEEVARRESEELERLRMETETSSETEVTESAKEENEQTPPILVIEDETDSEETEVEKRQTKETEEAKQGSNGFGSNTMIILLIGIAGAALIALVVFLLVYRRRKEAENKPQSEIVKKEEETIGFPARPEQSEPTVGMFDEFDERDMDKTVGIWDRYPEDPPKTVILTDLLNPARQYEVQVHKESILGRNKMCAITFSSDRTISGNHCKLINENGKIMVQDMESRNGTFVNGSKLDSKGEKKMELHTGDELKMGLTQLQVEIR